MYRTALRAASRPAARGMMRAAAPRRFASTVPADKPRSWKGSALRLGLAVAAVYYYNTSPVFAEEATVQTVPPPAAFSQDDVPTVDSVLAEKRKQIQARPKPAVETKPKAESPDAAQTAAADGSPAALEEEAGQQGAFNPETGEINWDCPCLGGMADGPCGEDFKAAFSCFVHSTEEPKGMDCIEKFQGMQECFKKYPEIYGAELADDDDDDESAAPEAEAAQKAAPAELPSDNIPQQQEEQRIVIRPKEAEDATDKNGVNVEDEQLVKPKKEEAKIEEKKVEA